MTATATFQPRGRELFVYDGRTRVGFHQLKTCKYAELDAVLATHGLAVKEGWVYLPGGGVYRAVLRTA